MVIWPWKKWISNFGNKHQSHTIFTEFCVPASQYLFHLPPSFTNSKWQGRLILKVILLLQHKHYHRISTPCIVSALSPLSWEGSSLLNWNRSCIDKTYQQRHTRAREIDSISIDFKLHTMKSLTISHKESTQFSNDKRYKYVHCFSNELSVITLLFLVHMIL